MINNHFRFFYQENFLWLLHAKPPPTTAAITYNNHTYFVECHDSMGKFELFFVEGGVREFLLQLFFMGGLKFSFLG
jgi:hypothetical protein